MGVARFEGASAGRELEEARDDGCTKLGRWNSPKPDDRLDDDREVEVEVEVEALGLDETPERVVVELWGAVDRYADRDDAEDREDGALRLLGATEREDDEEGRVDTLEGRLADDREEDELRLLGLRVDDGRVDTEDGREAEDRDEEEREAGRADDRDDTRGDGRAEERLDEDEEAYGRSSAAAAASASGAENKTSASTKLRRWNMGDSLGGNSRTFQVPTYSIRPPTRSSLTGPHDPISPTLAAIRPLVAPLYLLWSLSALILGASLGSFVGVAVSREPAGRSLWAPASACDTCDTPITGLDRVPILGWLLLGARCRHCGAPIPVAWPLLELVGALTVWLVFRRTVPHQDAIDLAHLSGFFVFALFATLLLAAAFTDVRARIIPTWASVHAVPVGIVCQLWLDGVGWHDPLAIGWQASILGALVGGGTLALLARVWRGVTGTEGLAWGDVRLVAMIGAFCGALPALWVVMLLASVVGAGLGIVAALRHGASGWLPFGPALAFAALAWVLYGAPLVRALLPGMTLWMAA